jgi:predicted amidohydrolase YtcJ
MGSAELSGQSSDESLVIGAQKFLFDESALPDLEALAESIREAHSSRRPVAIHSVTRSEILFALAAIEIAGALAGDRLEHASIAPPESVESARRLALTVVTQPNFVAERGDAYLRNVEASDQGYLYRLGGWLDAGVALGGGTDAPFGSPDPWRAMRSAVERRAPSGEPLGASEAISPERALALFTTRPEAPGGRPRELCVGARADLCLLTVPWSEARRELDSELVAATIRNGRPVWRSAGS